MNTLKYRIIKSEKQYFEYCDTLEKLLGEGHVIVQDEVELLTLLIEKWDLENSSLNELNPIELLKHLMSENKLKSKDIAEILRLSKGTVSKILNYQKGISKETIRKLSTYFKISQEAFNRPYKLKDEIIRSSENTRFGNTKRGTVKTKESKKYTYNPGVIDLDKKTKQEKKKVEADKKVVS